MKRLNQVLVVAAVAATLTFSVRGSAADRIALSPKERQRQSELRTVPGETNDSLDRAVKGGSPKWLAAQDSLRKVPGHSPDLLARRVIPGSPRYWANNSPATQLWPERFQIAPLK